MRHCITIQQGTKVPDGQGGYSTSWTTYAADIFAALKATRGSQFWISEQLQQRVTHSIIVRALEGVTTEMRVLFGARVFHIRAVRDQDERGRFLELLTEEGAPS
jgi:SPP1 family predicted phage head-tail adaptor